MATRRDALKLGAAATVAASLGLADAACSQAPAATSTAVAPGATTFLTKEELALLDELSELIVPADDHSPGARAAKAAEFIDRQLAEAFDPAERQQWRDGLARIEKLSHDMHGKAFLQTGPAQRVAVLTRIAQHEEKPQTPDEEFFVALKGRVVHAYYSSEIGIKQELEYKGNVFLQIGRAHV